MKCWKCTQTAVVHLTDLVPQADGRKRAVETHLCLAHASEAQLLMAQAGPLAPQKKAAAAAAAEAPPAVKVPAPTTTSVPAGPALPASGLAVVRKEPTAITVEGHGCPVCGTTWNQFKRSGLTGCPHDYTIYAQKLMPLIRRAQEGAQQHVGKVPAKLRQTDPARAIRQARLRRELEQALSVENYEHAARVRDEIQQGGQ
jgi:protein-arginine kinase activator protein McsA